MGKTGTDHKGWVVNKNTLVIKNNKGRNIDKCNTNTDGNELSWSSYSAAIKKVVIEEGVKEIPSGSFYDFIKLEEVCIPDSVEKIGRQAFHNCRSLKAIKLPTKLIEIGDWAFTFCVQLSNVVFKGKQPKMGHSLFGSCGMNHTITLMGPDWINSSVFNNMTLGKDVQVSYYVHGVYGEYSWFLNDGILNISPRSNKEDEENKTWLDYKNGIVEVEINSGVTRLCDRAFFECYELQHVSLPEQLEIIGAQAFHACMKIKTISIPASVKKIGNYAFTFCTSLETVYFLSATCPTIGIGLFDTDENADIITLVGSKKWVNSLTFDNVSIGKNAKVSYDVHGHEKNIIWSIKKGVLTLSDDGGGMNPAPFVFNNKCCSPWYTYRLGIYAVCINDNVHAINPGSFYECTNIKKVHIPPSVSIIGYQAFHACINIESIVLPASIKKIEDYAFAYCMKLAHIWFLSNYCPLTGVNIFDKINLPLLHIMTIGWHLPVTCNRGGPKLEHADIEKICN